MNSNLAPRPRTLAQAPDTAVSRRFALATFVALAVSTAIAPQPASAAPVDDAVRELQHDWETIRYKMPASERERRFADLADKAHRVNESFQGRAEPLIWEGIIVSSLAGEKGGLGALGMVKQAKALYEQAIQIDGNALEGSAYNSLGVLYYKVPGWPVGFGDRKKANALLQKALAINPNGIDPNFFFGEYLAENGEPDQAVAFLEKALQAPPRPGRQIADAGRRDEARQLLEKLKSR